ncbi:dipeptidase [Anaeromyxobacter sp. SG17]|uniref:dipeptidase n=1 Tax=Anaeromyxobacter sp. SG17 TaxID=2925405 RepID=UPI001F588F41|nr:membrane dipeptidase [Anaeromyxobacter sp. SG17]
MPSVLRRAAWIAAVLLLAAAGSFFFALAPAVAARMNRVDARRPLPAVSARARGLHATLRIVDLHDDLLLWDRDPLKRSTHGHSDVPRLAEGNVAVQLFSTVTEVPRGFNYAATPGAGDLVTALAVASRWPPPTWGSRLARALHQGEKLRRAAAASGGGLVVATSRAELAAALEARAAERQGRRAVVAVLATEGLQALDGRLEALDALFQAGFRSAGLAHFADNAAAGSAHGAAKGGLSALGRAALRRMEERRMIVDLAHASPWAFDDALSLARRPVIVSHTGVSATCPGPRNLTDDQLRRLARNGALVGIGYWEGAVCDRTPQAVARAIHHAIAVAGVSHVALGSDFDGATTAPFDAARLEVLTQALLDEGLQDAAIRAVMGENAIRFLLENLP